MPQAPLRNGLCLSIAPTIGVHLLGTCRMGNDPKTSVVDKFHRAHDVPNLFIVDGSSFVTSGRNQPTCKFRRSLIVPRITLPVQQRPGKYPTRPSEPMA